MKSTSNHFCESKLETIYKNKFLNPVEKQSLYVAVDASCCVRSTEKLKFNMNIVINLKIITLQIYYLTHPRGGGELSRRNGRLKGLTTRVLHLEKRGLDFFKFFKLIIRVNLFPSLQFLVPLRLIRPNVSFSN